MQLKIFKFFKKGCYKRYRTVTADLDIQNNFIALLKASISYLCCQFDEENVKAKLYFMFFAKEILIPKLKSLFFSVTSFLLLHYVVAAIA